MTDAKDLPKSPPDVFFTFLDFLKEVSDWIKSRATSKSAKRTGLACEVIRINGNKVFGGVGVYTICELFFDSGMFDYYFVIHQKPTIRRTFSFPH